MNDTIALIADHIGKIQTEGDDIYDNVAIFIADPTKNIYIQFAAGHDDTPDGRGEYLLYAEAVSNEFIAPDRQLTSQKILALKLSGWSEPRHSPNYTRVWTAGSDDDRIAIASEVIRLFREVYDISTFDDLVVDIHIA
jgi:hypothetical protein